MNLFDKDGFDRLRRFVRRTEQGLVESKQRAAVDPLPVRWQWYVVVDSGPDAEKDYVDERYWLKRAELTNSDSDTTSKVTEAEIPDTDDRFRHITATNMAEWPVGTHTVAVGTLVQVRVAYGAQSIETPRFWFVHGEGTATLYYLGGYFNAAGSIHAPGLAIQNGTRWYRYNYEEYPWFGQGNFITGMVMYGGELYAIGEFKVGVTVNTTPPTQASHFTTTATKMAKWDNVNERWIEFASSSTALGLATVNCIAIYNGNIIVGGTGTTTGVRQFNGTSFSDLGSSGTYLDEVNCFLEWNGDLYAGGNTGGADGLVVLSGSAWSQVAGGTNGTVRALAIHDDGTGEKLYFGGGFTQADSVNRRNIARYTGSAVESVWVRSATANGFQTGTSDVVYALASFGGKLWVGGVGMSPGLVIAVWDGDRISAAPFSLLHHSTGGSAPAAIVRALKAVNEPGTSKSILLAGGEFYYVSQAAAGEEIPFSGRYDAFELKFTTVSNSDLDGDVYQQASYGSVLYAVGFFEKSGDADCKYFAKLTGGSFTQAGQVDGRCYTAYALNDGVDDVLLVGGKFTQINGTDAASSIFRLNGTTLDAPFDVELGGAAGLVRKIRGDYLCGAFDTVGGVTTLGLAKVTWSGGNPTATMLVDTLSGGDAQIYDVCTDGTYLYATGSFTTIGNSVVATPVSANNVARMLLSTGEWSAMSTGFTAKGIACSMHNGSPIFSSDVSPWIRKWNGSAFVALLDSGGDAGPPNSTGAGRAPKMLEDTSGTLHVDYGGTDQKTRLAYLPAGGEWAQTGDSIPASATAGIFDRPIRSVIEFDSGSGTQIHVGGEFTRIGDDSGGNQILPRCCLASIARGGYTNAFLGGIGGKVLQSTASGETNYVMSISQLEDVPGLTGTSIGVGGRMEIASNITCNGICSVTSAGRFGAVGQGLRYRSANGGKAFVGARDILVDNRGRHYFAGPFDEGINPQAAGQSAPVSVGSTGIIAWEANEFISLSPTGVEAVSNLAESQTNSVVVNDTDYLASQFTPGGSAPSLLKSVTVRLQNSGGSAVRVRFAIYNDTSGAPNAPQYTFPASATIAASTTANVTIEGNFQVSNGTPYWLVVSTEGDDVAVHCTSSDASTSTLSWTIGDDSVKSTDSGATWGSALGYVGLFSAVAADTDQPIGDGYVMLTDGSDSEGNDRIVLGHTNGIHRWDWVDEAWTDIFTNIDTSTVTPLFLRFARLGTDEYVCGAFQITSVGDVLFAKFNGTNQWTKITPPTGVTSVTDIVVGDIGNGTRLYIIGGVSAAENCVYEYDGSTFTVVGPSGTGAGALYGTAYGIAIVDFGSGPVLVAVGGTISATAQVMAVFDFSGNAWSGTGTYSVLGQLAHADAVIGGTRLIGSGLRLAALITDNPDVGVVILDSVGQYNPTDGWQRIGGVYGCNEQVNVAGD